MAVLGTLAEISPEAELRELLGTPAPRVITKARTKTVQPRGETLEELERCYGPQYGTHLYG